MNKIEQLWADALDQAVPETYTQLNETQMLRVKEEFAQQIVGETILQILATDHRHAMFTTFDRAAIDGATARIVDNVTKHWNFK